MKNTTLLFLAFLFVIFQAVGQESKLYKEIQQSKSANVTFKSISFFQAAGADTAILKEFNNPNDVFFFETISGLQSDTGTRAIAVSIPMDTNNMVLELLEVSDYFYNYQVVTSSGDTFPANRNIKSYRGAVKGEANSFAAITFYGDEAMGLIVVGNNNFEIAKDKSSGKHIFYNTKNRKTQPQGGCETVDDLSLSYNPTVLLGQHNNVNKQGRGTTIDKLVRFYVETRYDIYRTCSYSVPNTEAFIMGLFNQVGLLYENEGILTSVSDIYVWTSYDPYSYTDATSLLVQFANIRTSINGDLGILLTFETNNGGGAAMGFNGLCNSLTRNKLAVADIDYDFYTPTYNDRIYLITHEFGHLLGSRHTNACAWEVNGVLGMAIDGCYQVEGGCPDPGLPLEGTIMSNCALINGVGVNFNLGFGLQPGNVIRYNVANATCLQCAPEYIIDYKNEIVTINTEVSGCEVNVQNVTVTNGSKLKLESTEKQPL